MAGLEAIECLECSCGVTVHVLSADVHSDPGRYGRDLRKYSTEPFGFGCFQRLHNEQHSVRREGGEVQGEQ